MVDFTNELHFGLMKGGNRVSHALNDDGECICVCDTMKGKSVSTRGLLGPIQHPMQAIEIHIKTFWHEQPNHDLCRWIQHRDWKKASLVVQENHGLFLNFQSKSRHCCWKKLSSPFSRDMNGAGVIWINLHLLWESHWL